MSIELICARKDDLELLLQYDRHIARLNLMAALADRRCYIISSDGQPVGSLRYSLFWDSIPFLNLICIADDCQREGIGSQAMALWEDMMRGRGYGMAMLSTQSDESSQHFYRALGYRESGCLLFDLTGYEQPMEIVFSKPL